MHSNELVGGPLQDLIETAFTSPYMGVFDADGLHGHMLQRFEELFGDRPHRRPVPAKRPNSCVKDD